MYSMVLMMALQTGAAAPAGHGCWGGHGHCYGGYGCWGYSACYGYGHGCYGYSYGCYGGHHRHGHRRSHGCYGGYAYSSGCYGYGHGCYGYAYNCCGGYVSYGCRGGYGAPVGAPPGKAPEKMPAPEGGEKKPGVGALSNQAQLVVSLPADAKLTIDGQATSATSATRTFVTPELQPGMTYIYNLKAEVVADGKPVAVTKTVTVRAGEVTRVNLDVPVATTASK
jgi:uncharacterized protein (TIGR03000 family)